MSYQFLYQNHLLSELDLLYWASEGSFGKPESLVPGFPRMVGQYQGLADNRVTPPFLAPFRNSRDPTGDSTPEPFPLRLPRQHRKAAPWDGSPGPGRGWAPGPRRVSAPRPQALRRGPGGGRAGTGGALAAAPRAPSRWRPRAPAGAAEGAGPGGAGRRWAPGPGPWVLGRGQRARSRPRGAQNPQNLGPAPGPCSSWALLEPRLCTEGSRAWSLCWLMGGDMTAANKA